MGDARQAVRWERGRKRRAAESPDSPGAAAGVGVGWGKGGEAEAQRCGLNSKDAKAQSRNEAENAKVGSAAWRRGETPAMVGHSGGKGRRSRGLEDVDGTRRHRAWELRQAPEEQRSREAPPDDRRLPFRAVQDRKRRASGRCDSGGAPVGACRRLGKGSRGNGAQRSDGPQRRRGAKARMGQRRGGTGGGTPE